MIVENLKDKWRPGDMLVMTHDLKLKPTIWIVVSVPGKDGKCDCLEISYNGVITFERYFLDPKSYYNLGAQFSIYEV